LGQVSHFISVFNIWHFLSEAAAPNQVKRCPIQFKGTSECIQNPIQERFSSTRNNIWCIITVFYTQRTWGEICVSIRYCWYLHVNLFDFVYMQQNIFTMKDFTESFFCCFPLMPCSVCVIPVSFSVFVCLSAYTFCFNVTYFCCYKEHTIISGYTTGKIKIFEYKKFSIFCRIKNSYWTKMKSNRKCIFLWGHCWIHSIVFGRCRFDSSGSGYGPGVCSYEHSDEPSGSIKCGEFFD
jgi:hypothetical protein